MTEIIFLKNNNGNYDRYDNSTLLLQHFSKYFKVEADYGSRFKTGSPLLQQAKPA